MLANSRRQGGAIDVRVYNEYRQIASNKGTPPQDSEIPLTELIVEISDNGMGISSETLPRIFTAFEQGARSRNRSFGGLGLGLSISRAIMDLHGGSIAAASEGKDKGAQFSIRLHTVKPVVAAGAEQPLTSSPELTPERPSARLGRRRSSRHSRAVRPLAQARGT